MSHCGNLYSLPIPETGQQVRGDLPKWEKALAAADDVMTSASDAPLHVSSPMDILDGLSLSHWGNLHTIPIPESGQEVRGNLPK